MNTDDLRANASNWTLAGDVALLAHLQKFSDVSKVPCIFRGRFEVCRLGTEILKQAEATEGALNNLLDQAEDTSAKFNNISNQFLCLQNTQFIENRVYDDDTPIEEIPVKTVVEPDNQQQTLIKYKEAVSIGLKLLDSHYDEVDIPESSDSDDDSPGSSKPLLLRPKPAYLKPLPLLIGSADWWADDTVGLGKFQRQEDSDHDMTASESEDAPCPEITGRSSSASSIPSREQSSDENQPYQTPPSFKPNIITQHPHPAEDTVKKRVDGSSTFGPEDLFGNYKTDQVKNNDLFGSSDSLAVRPIGRDLFSPPENLFDDPPPISSRISPSIPSQTVANHEKDNSGEDSLSAQSSQHLVQPKLLLPKVQTDFTKELFARLKSASHDQTTPTEVEPHGENAAKNDRAAQDSPGMQKKDTNAPNALPGLFDSNGETQSIITKVPEATRSKSSHESSVPSSQGNNTISSTAVRSKPPTINLFGDDEDSEDDLFGAANKFIGSSKNSNSTSGLFDHTSNNIFTSSKDQMNNKIDITSTKKNDLMPQGKLTKKSSLFSDDLFDDDEDDLFPSTFNKKPSRVSFPDVSDSTSKSIKSSTPGRELTNRAESPTLNSSSRGLFDSIPKLETSSEQSQSEIIEDSHHDQNVADTRDLGFIEGSNISDSLATSSEAKNSPVSWFLPQLSSTHSTSANGSSGYNTGTHDVLPEAANSRADERTRSSIPESSISTIQPKNDSTSKTSIGGSGDGAALGKNSRGNNENSTSSGSKSVLDTSKPLILDDDDNDDLFRLTPSVRGAITSEPRKNNGEHSSNIIEDSKVVNLTTDKPYTSILGKSHSTGPKSLFDDDDDDGSSLFFDGKTGSSDNISFSSSKSSIFDDVLPGRSTLPHVFGNKYGTGSSVKTSLFDDVDDDIDIFATVRKPHSDKNTGVESNVVTKKIEQNLGKVFAEQDTTISAVSIESKVEVVRAMIDDDNTLKSQKGLFNITAKDDENDLFSDKPLLSSVPQNHESKSLFLKSGFVEKNEENSNHQTSIKDLQEKFSSDFTVSTKNVSEPRPNPPNTLDIKKISDSLMKEPDEPDGEIAHKAVNKVIGKLNFPKGLNINTAALLPGAKHTAFKKPTSPTSDQPTTSVLPKDVDVVSRQPASQDLLPSALKDRARIPVKRRPQSRRARQEALRVSGIDFGAHEDTETGSSTLSTESNQYFSAENTPSSDFASPPLSNPLSPSTDGEDYFNVPALNSNDRDEDCSLFAEHQIVAGTNQKPEESLLFKKPSLISPANVNSVDISIHSKSGTSKNNQSLDGAENVVESGASAIIESKTKSAEPDTPLFNEDNALFGGKTTPSAFLGNLSAMPIPPPAFDEGPPPISAEKSVPYFDEVPEAPAKSTAKISSIFDDDDDDDDDLFTSAMQKPISNKYSMPFAADAENKPFKSIPPAHSLFADSDDEDDNIFTGVRSDTASKKKTSVKPPAPATVSNPVSEPKVMDNFVDPLGLLGDKL